MKRKVKNTILVVLVLAIALGAVVFFFYSWFMRQPKYRDDLYELFRTRMDEKYGSDEESANVRMENNDSVLVFLGRAREGEEAYYEIYQIDWRRMGEDAWNGPTKTGTIHRGDDVKQILQEIRDQPDQWIYLFFSEDAIDVQAVDNGESRTIRIKPDTPRAVITETPPEELQIIHNTES